jgi:drug/metabolite transporter (DMT)-like permease
MHAVATVQPAADVQGVGSPEAAVGVVETQSAAPAARSSAGIALCIASASAFGAMAVLGKVAYDHGATVGTLLSVRFIVAAALMWVLVAVRGDWRGLQRRDVVTGLLLGAIGYAAQSGAFFAALERMDAGLLSLVLYTYPALVTVAAIALRRERANRRRMVALGMASLGLVLVLAGAGSGTLDPLGVALGLAAAVVYTTYILVSEGATHRIPPLALAALVCTGAATTLTIGSAAIGELHPGALDESGLAAILGIAAISTVAAISLFFAGLKRVGPSTASILSTAEPVVTVILAYAAFGEHLSAQQLLGGALVLGAVVVLATRGPLRLRARFAT